MSEGDVEVVSIKPLEDELKIDTRFPYFMIEVKNIDDYLESEVDVELEVSIRTDGFFGDNDRGFLLKQVLTSIANNL